jgi:hypothetical protein
LRAIRLASAGVTSPDAVSRGDVLAAASLLLAILAVLYSLWYAEIARTLEIKAPKHLDDAAADRRRTSEVLRTRALPLALAALILMLTFLPEALHIAVHFVRRAHSDSLWQTIKQYDPVSLSLVIVVVGIGALAAYTGWLAVRLWRLKRTLTPPKSSP